MSKLLKIIKVLFKNQISIFITIFLLTLSPLCFSQTSPGGVLSSTDCKLWIDAGDMNGDGNYTNNPSVNTAVGTWNDKSGNSNNLTQGTAAAKPTYTTLGGFSCVYFDNTGSNANYLTATTQAMLTPGTMYFVLYMVDAGDGANCLFDRNVSANTSIRFAQWSATGELGYTKYATADYVTTMASSFTTNVIVSYLKTSASNNVVIAQNSSSISLTVGSSNPGLPLYVLGKNSTTDGMNGYIMEALAYDLDLNLTQRNIVDNYFSAKYGGISILADKYAGDLASNGNYDFEMGGVGTESSGGNNSAASSITGGLGATQATAMENGEYLMYAHQTGSNGLDFSDVGGMSAGTNKARWKRIWYLDWTHVGGTNETVNLVFDYSDAGSAGGSAGGTVSNYKLLYRSGQSGAWTEVMSASSIAGDRVTFNGVAWNSAGDGYYTIGTLDNTTSPLPLELVSFDAESCDPYVCLDWTCATEKNTDHFLVEHSQEGENWTTFTQLPAAGNSSSKTHYAVIDENPFEGTSYYRITTVDLDQSVSYSPLKSVFIQKRKPEINVFPNPSNGTFNLVSNGYNLQSFTFTLINAVGKILDVSPSVQENNTNAILNLGEQSAGVYYLRITDPNGFMVVNKLVKQ